MKNLLFITVLSLILMACKKKMSEYRVEISSAENINGAIIKGYDYHYEDNNMTTNYIEKEFENQEVGKVGVTAFGQGNITIKMWRDGVLQEKSGSGASSGLNLEY